jgi:hypothetical protein
MPEIGISGSMSGVGKRGLPATAPNLDSTQRQRTWWHRLSSLCKKHSDFRDNIFNYIFQTVVMYLKKFVNKVG